jgi:hypothetical protein
VLFAAGVFSSAGGRPARGLAQFVGGRWSAVGGGVRGSVFALGLLAMPPALTRAEQLAAAAGLAASGGVDDGVRGEPCLYVAGDLSLAVEADGSTVPAANVMRFCGFARPEAGWQALIAHGIPPVHALLAAE